MCDGALSHQIGSDASGVAALGDRGAGGWVPRNCSFRETTEGEGESGGGLHLNADVGEEEDAGSCCHRARYKDSCEISPTWRANYRIAYPASPPGVCPAVDL